MRTRDQQRLDDQQMDAGKRSPRKAGSQREGVEGSLRELQSTAGNRAVSDLLSVSRPIVQGSFFGGFGGVDDWIAKEAPQATPGFDASMKHDTADASTKQEPSDQSVKLEDASDRWDPSQKLDASDKWDSSQKLDASDKWDSSQKLDASDKWDESAKSEPDLYGKNDALEAANSEFELF